MYLRLFMRLPCLLIYTYGISCLVIKRLRTFMYHYFSSKILFWSVKSLGELCKFWVLIILSQTDISFVMRQKWSIQSLLSIGSVFMHRDISNEVRNICRLHYAMIVDDFKRCQVLLKKFYRNSIYIREIWGR